MTSRELKITKCWPRTFRCIISPEMNVQLLVAKGHWLWFLGMLYRRSYAIHHKQPKLCRPACRKGYRSVDILWGLVVGEDRSDYHPCPSSTVWITRRRKRRQPTHSRYKTLAALLLTSWQTLRTCEETRTAKLIRLLYYYSSCWDSWSRSTGLFRGRQSRSLPLGRFFGILIDVWPLVWQARVICLFFFFQLLVSLKLSSVTLIHSSWLTIKLGIVYWLSTWMADRFNVTCDSRVQATGVTASQDNRTRAVTYLNDNRTYLLSRLCPSVRISRRTVSLGHATLIVCCLLTQIASRLALFKL